MAQGASRPPPAATPEEVKRQIEALVAGLMSAGGATDDISRAVGRSDVADANAKARAGDPISAGIGSMLNPMSILGPIRDVGAGLYEAVAGPDEKPPELMSMDAFAATRRTKRGSLKDAQDAAEAKVMENPAYQSLLKPNDGGTIRQSARNAAREMIETARKQAAIGWEADQKNIGAEDERIGTDYAQYKADHDKALEAYYGRDFADRNPRLASALPLIGGGLAALLTKGVFGKLAGKANKLNDEAAQAWKAGDAHGFAKAKSDAEWWDRNAGKIKAGTVAGAAAIPIEARFAANSQDAAQSGTYQKSTGEWVQSKSQQRAEENFSDPKWYLKEGALGLLTGGLGAFAGSKLAKKADEPFARIGVLPKSADVDAVEASKLAEIASKQRIAAAENAAKQPGTASPGTGATPVPAGPSGASAAPQATSQLPQPLGPQSPPSPAFAAYDPATHGAVSRAYLDEVLSFSHPSRTALSAQPNQPGAAATVLQGRFVNSGLPPVDPTALQSRAADSLSRLDDLGRALGIDGSRITEPRFRQAVLEGIAGKATTLGLPLTAAGVSELPPDLLDALVNKILSDGGA